MDKKKFQKGKIIIVSGPSGVGKSTICKAIVNKLENVYLSVSATTRPKTPGEIDGRDYWFLSEQEFEERLNKGLFLEHAEVFGNCYGTPKDKVEEALQAGRNIILEIDVQGARQVKAAYPDSIMIFILPPTEKTLAERLNRRGRDDIETTEERLDWASDEIAAAWQYYKHMVVNDDLNQAINECLEIVKNA